MYMYIYARADEELVDLGVPQERDQRPRSLEVQIPHLLQRRPAPSQKLRAQSVEGERA